MTHSRLLAAAGTVLIALTTVLTAIPARAQDASVGITKRQIYPPIDSAAADITAALDEARASHKRVIVDFGGDWCPDCQVLNIYFHQSPNA